MKTVVVISGRKQSGKDTLARMIAEECGYGEEVIFHFAYRLKKFCNEILGIPASLLWGTDEDKNVLTHLTWEGMPFGVRCRNSNWRGRWLGWVSFLNPRRGRMAVREVLQVFGTDIIRKMRPDAWVQAAWSDAQAHDSGISVIADARFDNELSPCSPHSKVNTVAVRLGRTGYEDAHYSENGVSDFSRFDYHLDSDSTLDDYRDLARWISSSLGYHEEMEAA